MRLSNQNLEIQKKPHAGKIMDKDVENQGSVELPEAGNDSYVPVEVTYQRQLLPLDVINTFPWGGDNAHLRGVVEARDGQHYGVKMRSEGGMKVPASEFFCHELAWRLQIATPAHAVIRMPSGEFAFGSLWQGGVEKGSGLEYQMFIDSVLRGEKKVVNIKRFFSRLYAFDLFVNNVDRGWRNFLWRSSFGGSTVGLAFDFSRACFETGYAGMDATKTLTNTHQISLMVRASKNYDCEEAIACLEEIRSISQEDISYILSSLPDDWMAEKEKLSYIDWWQSEARHDRLNVLIQFCRGDNV
jgi:hypothetical protein